MKIGAACWNTYDGPTVDHIEFGVPDAIDNVERRRILDSFTSRFGSVSCHLPPLMPASDLEAQVEFDDGRVDFFVVHVTRHTPFERWRDLLRTEKRLVFENHNENRSVNAGWIRALEFQSLVDAGGQLCLDTGHILYSCMTLGCLEDAERVFEEFLELPIASTHLHTLGVSAAGHQVDHQLEGYDIGPWVRKLETKFPDIILMPETGDPRFSATDKLNALQRWRGGA